MRGKRMSTSANGLAQSPHDTIPATEFYRHIDADQSDPVRMRQLLVWCAKRAKDALVKGSGVVPDNVDKVAEDIIRGLVSKQINTSWYHRSDRTALPGSMPQETKPNPQNVLNASKKAELESELARLVQEEALWQGIVATASASAASAAADAAASNAAATGVASVGNGIDEVDLVDLLTQREKNVLELVVEEEERFKGCGGVGVWAAENVNEFQMQIHEMKAAADSVTEEVGRSRKQCEKLFASWLKAHDKERTARLEAAKPIDLLRLLPPTAAAAAVV